MKWIIQAASSEHEVEISRHQDRFEISLDGEKRDVDFIMLDGAIASLRYRDDGRSFFITFQREGRREYRVAALEREFSFKVQTPVEAVVASAGSAGAGADVIRAPIPGKVVAVHVAEGDVVEAGRAVVVLEAMKMENELVAERSGRVASVEVEAGDVVAGGAVLVRLEGD